MNLKIDCPNVINNGKIVIVGEAPGACESGQCICSATPDNAHGHAREPFVGESGRLLRKMYGIAGIKGPSLCNVSQFRPPGNDFDAYFYRAGKPTVELKEWRRRLQQQLDNLRPNVVVAAGAEACKALLPDFQGITKERGGVLVGHSGLKVIPILHPAYLLRGNYSNYYITIDDLRKAKRHSGYPEPRYREYENIIQPTYLRCIDFIRSIGDDEPYAIDIETRGGEIACLALATRAEVVCVPLHTTTGPYFSASEEALLWKSIGTLFTQNPHLIGQNLAFDLEFLFDYGVVPSGVPFDTMVAHNLLYPELPKGLDFLCSVYLDVPYYKDEGKTWNSKTPDLQLWNYNNKDAIYTLWIASVIGERLTSAGLKDTYETLSGASLLPALEMQRQRLRRDPQYTKQINHVLDGSIKRSHQSVVAEAGEEINVVSPKQVATQLYEKRGLTPLARRGRSTDENVLRALRANTGDALVTKIILERHLRKRKSSYADIQDDPDGYLPYGVNVAGTESWRWSMKKSVHGRGCNVQTVPKIMRLAYVPPPGHIFLQPDLSQAESRVVAWDAQCGALISRYLDKSRNIHIDNAFDIFGTVVEKDSLQYTLAKSMVHAANYRMGPGRLAAETGISLNEAKRILARITTLYPEIGVWHEAIKQEILDTGRLVTCTGRSRTFYEMRGAVEVRGKVLDKHWREAVSFKPQATVAEVTTKGLVVLWQQCPWMRFHLQVHDSLLVSVPIGALEESTQLVRDALTIPLSIRGRELTIPVDVQCGFNWGMLKNYEGEKVLTHGDWQNWATGEWNRLCAKSGCTKLEYIESQLQGNL